MPLLTLRCRLLRLFIFSVDAERQRYDYAATLRHTLLLIITMPIADAL